MRTLHLSPSILGTIGLALIVSASAPPAFADARSHETSEECPRHARTYHLARIQEENDLLLGPVKVTLEGVNRLRYDVVVGQKVTLDEGPDLSVVPFVPALGSVDTESLREDEDEAPEAAGIAPTGPGLSASDIDQLSKLLREHDDDGALAALIAEIERRVRLIEGQVTGLSGEVAALNQEAEDARKALLDASAKFEDLVADSETLLRNGGPRALAREIPVALRCLREAEPRLRWPDAAAVASLRTRIQEQVKALDQLHFIPGFPDWHDGTGNAKRYEALRSRMAGLLTALAKLDEGSDATKAFRAGRKALADHKRLLQSLLDGQDPEQPFRLDVCVPCGFPRFKSKEAQVTLTYTERFPAEGKEPKVTVREIVTVACPSRFAVAGGIGIADVEEHSFTFVDSLPDPAPPEMPEPAPQDEGDGAGENGDGGGEEDLLVKRIDAETSADRVVAATAVIHTQLWRRRTQDEPAIGFHFTAGAALKLDGGSETPLGYLAGLSFSFQENLFLTLGWQFHRVTALAGGFEEGQVVPDELAAPPTKTEWDDGPAVTITYKIGS